MLFMRNSARYSRARRPKTGLRNAAFPRGLNSLNQQATRMSPSEHGATNPAAATATGVDKRRSTRVVQAMPIKVHGVDALSEPFTERTTTVMVSCHGCKYQSKHYVPKGSIVTVEIPRRNPSAPARIIAGNVIWVQRPSHARDLLHIGLEFEVPGNVWDYPAAPDDWFPLPGEQAFRADDMEEPQAIPTVIRAAREDKSDKVRRQAMNALARSKDPAALRFFEDVLVK